MTSPTTLDKTPPVAKRVAAAADNAWQATERATSELSQAVDTKLDTLRQTAPTALARATAQAEDLARRGIDRARQASSAVREQAARVGDQTVGYIKDEPVKSVVMAAAAGAVTALLLRWLARSGSDRG